MRLLHCVFLGLVVACFVAGQTYTISTIAGGGLPVNIPGTSADLSHYGLKAVAVDGAGNVFFTDWEGPGHEGVVLRLDAITGILTLLYQGNPATGFAVDSAGNLYIADSDSKVIRKVSNGVITTVAGNGTNGSGDGGPATSAQLGASSGIAVDSAGNLYIADYGNNRIRKVSDGVITTVAGNGTNGFSGDGGPATSAQVSAHVIAVDSAGNLYIASDYRIRKVSDGIITTVAGNGTRGVSGDNGPATSAQLSEFRGIAVDSAGNLYIADTDSKVIRKVSNGVITTVAGNWGAVAIGDNGPATSAQLGFAQDIAVDSKGNLYIADGFSRIRKVSGGVITTVAGGLGDGGPATTVRLSFCFDEIYMDHDALLSGVAVDPDGNLYITDCGHGGIRKISGGVITTVAGNATYGFSGDNGPATSAQLNLPTAVAVDSAGNLYIADRWNGRIRKVSGGVITTVAGNGTYGFNGDGGPATSAQLSGPLGIAVDSAGNLYIADTYRVRKVSDGVITTVVTCAAMAIAVDSTGNLYIADFSNRISKVADGVITTVAGGGSSLGDGGPATSAQLSFTTGDDAFSWLAGGGIAVDSTGNLYIADYGNHRIRKVSNGVITTVAGNGTYGFNGDGGPATSAQLSGPLGIAVDSAGNIYVSDASNRVRLLQPQPDSSEASPTRPAISPRQ